MAPPAATAKRSRLRVTFKIYAAFAPYLRPYWRKLALACASLAGTVAMTLLEPWPLKFVFDDVLLEKRLHGGSQVLLSAVGASKPALLLVLCLGLVLIVILNNLFFYANRYLLAAVGRRVINDIRLDLFTHVQRLPLSGEARTGDVVLQLTSGIKALRDLLLGHVQKFANQALSFFSALAVMLWLDWRLTLLALVIVPPLWVVSYYFSTNIRAATRRKQAKESEMAAIVQEAVTSAAVIQAFAQEKREKKRFARESVDSLSAAMESTGWGKGFQQLVKLMSTCGLALVVYYGARQALNGRITPGDIIVFTAYVRNLYSPIQSFTGLISDYMEALVSGESILALAEWDTAVRDLPDAIKAPRFAGKVEFRNVVFGYQPNKPVIRGLSLSVEAGEMVALVGSSGTGKTTLMNLLLRFVEPWQGSILIDGQDIRQFKLKSLRKQITVLPQEPVVFRRTVRENIAFGQPKAAEEEIVEAARAAHAHHFIMNLPHGYDTVLKERGANLSGGQRQRLALARAILRDAPILVLDEPVTGLDAITEAQVYEALWALIKNRTAFVIAHRLATVKKAHAILLFEGGQVIDRGTHEDLMDRNIFYRALYDLQGRHFTAGSQES
jgi:ATP-binding cassette subfamily B protein